MLIAGEASGDMLGRSGACRGVARGTSRVRISPTSWPIRNRCTPGWRPRFFWRGAGNRAWQRRAMEDSHLISSNTRSSAFLRPKTYLEVAGGAFLHLMQLAIERQPDVIVGIDYNYFNLKFGHIIRQYCSQRAGWFQDWRPKLVKYISPQVWASRGGRAYEFAEKGFRSSA